MSNIDWSRLVSPEQKRADVVSRLKVEARRRILEIMPEHKQRNTMAMGLEAIQTYGPDVSKWPADLKRENEAALAAWSKINAIRARTNEIEAMTNIPENISDDSLWSI